MTAPTDDLEVEHGGHRAVVSYEPFDSEFLGLVIGRAHVVGEGLDQAELEGLLRATSARSREAGYDHLLRRVPASAYADIWALESAGFHVMDVGVTFARRVDGSLPGPTATDVAIRPATTEDIEDLLETMLEVPWGSRYEADPHYDRAAVQRLQARWLRNSMTGRADHVLVGHLDGRPAGYVTCRLVEEHGEQIGEIDLVGTAPAARGRGVAATIVHASLAWFAERVSLVTVRTQATNYTASGVYERAGMTLRESDMTFRAALTPRGGLQ